MLRNALTSAVLVVSIDTPNRSTTDRLTLPQDSRAAAAMYRTQLQRVLDVYDPFQHGGQFAPLAA